MGNFGSKKRVQSYVEMTRAFKRLMRDGTSASDAYKIAMDAAAEAGYGM